MLGGSLYLFALYLAVWYRKALLFRGRRFNIALYYAEACSLSSSSTSTMRKPINAAYRAQPVGVTNYPRRTSPPPRRRRGRFAFAWTERRKNRRPVASRVGVETTEFAGEAEVCFAWQTRAAAEASGRGSSLCRCRHRQLAELSVRGSVG